LMRKGSMIVRGMHGSPLLGHLGKRTGVSDGGHGWAQYQPLKGAVGGERLTPSLKCDSQDLTLQAMLSNGAAYCQADP
jgi:hypothetical protein